MRRASISVNQNNGYWDNKNKLFQTQQDNQEQQQIKRNSTNFQIFKQSPNKMLQQKRTGEFSNKQSINNFLSQHQNDLIEQSMNQDESLRSKSISAADLQNSLSKSTFSNQGKSNKKNLNAHVTNKSMNLYIPKQRFSRGILPSKTQNLINLKYSSKRSSQVILQNPEIINQQNPDSGSTNNINKKQESKDSDDDSSSEQLSQNEEDDDRYNIYDVRHRSNINKIKTLKKRNKDLKQTIQNTKIFLNMVIHDLRNPTSQISFTIQFIIDYLKKQNETKYSHVQELIDFFEKYENELLMIIDNLEHDKVKEQLYYEQNTYNLLEKIQQMQIEILKYKNQIEILENKIFKSQDLTIPSERLQQNNLNCQVNMKEFDLKEQSKLNSEKISEFIHKIKERKEVFLQNFQKELQDKNSVKFMDKSIEKINKIDEYIQIIKSQTSIIDNTPQQINNSIMATCMFDLAEEDENGRIIINFDDKNNKETKSQIPKSVKYLSYDFQMKNISNDRKQETMAMITPMKLNELDKKEEIILQRNESEEIDQQSVLKALKEEWINVKIQAVSFREFMSQDENQVFDLLQTCSHSSSMLLNLINDLLDLAKHEKLTFKVNKDYFNFISAIESTFKTMEFLAQKRNIKMILKIDPLYRKYFECFFGDEKRWEQIFLNFISNSLKFSKNDGTVTVEINLIKCSSAILNDQIKRQKSINNSFEEKNSVQKIQKDIRFNSNQNEMPKQKKSVQFSVDAIALENLSHKIQTFNEKNSLNSIFENQKLIQQLNGKEVKSIQVISNLKKLSFQESHNFLKQNQQIQNSDSFYTLKNQPSIVEQINNLKRNQKDYNQNTESNDKTEIQLIQFEVKIIDNGEGISQEGISQLFMNFKALDEHQKTNTRGTGLGLSICKQIIENMGGRVNVQSKIGEGTTFTITLNALCLLKQSIQDEELKQVLSIHQIVQQGVQKRFDKLSNSELTNLFFQNISLYSQRFQPDLINQLQNIENDFSYSNRPFIKNPQFTYDQARIKLNKLEMNDSFQYQLNSNNKNNSYDQIFKSNQNSLNHSYFEEEKQSNLKFLDQKQHILNTNDFIDAIQTSEASEVFCDDYKLKLGDLIRGDTADKKNEHQRDKDIQENQIEENQKSVKESLSQIDEEDNKQISSTSSIINLKRRNLKCNIKKLEQMNYQMDTMQNQNRKLKSTDSKNSIQNQAAENKQINIQSIEDYLVDDEDDLSYGGPSNIIKKYDYQSKGNFMNIKNRKSINQPLLLKSVKSRRLIGENLSQDILHQNSSLKVKLQNNKQVKSIISNQSHQYSENINNSAQINMLIQDITQELDESDYQGQSLLNSQSNNLNVSRKSQSDMQIRQNSHLSSLSQSQSQIKIMNKNQSSNSSNLNKYNFNQVSLNRSYKNETYPILKILIANDEPMQLLILKTLLNKINGIKIELHSANNGQEAYEAATFQNPIRQIQKLNTKELQSEIQTLKASIKGEILEVNNGFDIIILDLNMPIMDGLQSCQSIRTFQLKQLQSNDDIIEQKQQNHPFIVALSASNFDEQLINQCKNSGFDEFLSVPLSYEDLRIKVIHRYLMDFKGMSKDQILLYEDHHLKIQKTTFLQSPNISSLGNFSSGLSFLNKFNKPNVLRSKFVRNNSLGNTDHDQNLSLLKNQKPKKLPTANIQVKSKFSQNIQN